MIEKCKFCDYVFKDGENFTSHSCKLSDRLKKVRTANGVVAFDLYKLWRSKKGFATISPDTFISSKYFTVFINLSDFMAKKSIPLRQHYLDFCIKTTLLPNNWYSETVYMEYLLHYEHDVDPVTQYNISKKTILTLTDMIGCERNQTLSYLTFDEISKLIYSKNLSPWFLLFNNTFNNIYKHKLTKEERILCDTLINRDIWIEKLRSNKELCQTIIALIKTDKF